MHVLFTTMYNEIVACVQSENMLTNLRQLCVQVRAEIAAVPLRGAQKQPTNRRYDWLGNPFSVGRLPSGINGSISRTSPAAVTGVSAVTRSSFDIWFANNRSISAELTGARLISRRRKPRFRLAALDTAENGCHSVRKGCIISPTPGCSAHIVAYSDRHLLNTECRSSYIIPPSVLFDSGASAARRAVIVLRCRLVYCYCQYL